MKYLTKKKNCQLIRKKYQQKNKFFGNRNKSRGKWLIEGDRNTKKIHNSTIHNRTINTITKIKDGDDIIEDKPTKVVEIFIAYYENLLNNFNVSNRKSQEKVLRVIPKVVT